MADAERCEALAIAQRAAGTNPAVTDFRRLLAAARNTLGLVLIRTRRAPSRSSRLSDGDEEKPTISPEMHCRKRRSSRAAKPLRPAQGTQAARRGVAALPGFTDIPYSLAQRLPHARAHASLSALSVGSRPKSKPMRRHPRCAPSLEPLEDRLAPAVRLTYEGALGISLVEQASGATPTVTISENIPTQLRIDLGGETFDAQSTAQGSQGAAGLTYQTGAHGEPRPTPPWTSAQILDG